MDLMRLGHRLRDLDDPLSSGLTFTDVIDIVEHTPEDSALYRAAQGDDSVWSLTNQLLAAQFDAMNLQMYQAGGGKGKKPKPLPRPGASEKEQKKYKSTKLSTVTEIDEWMKGRMAG